MSHSELKSELEAMRVQYITAAREKEVDAKRHQEDVATLNQLKERLEEQLR